LIDLWDGLIRVMVMVIWDGWCGLLADEINDAYGIDHEHACLHKIDQLIPHVISGYKLVENRNHIFRSSHRLI